MKRLIAFGIFLNASLIGFRVWQEGFALAGSEPVGNGDVNGDGDIDLCDATYLLNWLFLGGAEPVAIAQDRQLEDRVAAIEAGLALLEGKTTLSDLAGCNAGDVPKWDGNAWRCAVDADTHGVGLTPEQEEILEHFSIVNLPTERSGGTARTVRLTGANLQIVNGLGATNGNPESPLSVDDEETSTNGLGNLIIGYNESAQVCPGYPRTGSHNLVVGVCNSFTSYGGAVIGNRSRILNSYASVTGGFANTASGKFSAVSGGWDHRVSGDYASVSGGIENLAEGRASWVGGGVDNLASGENAAISGGAGNVASGNYSAVSGGLSNEAFGELSTVAGGGENRSGAFATSVSGGRNNSAGFEDDGDLIGNYSTVSGGEDIHLRVEGGHAPNATGDGTELTP